MKNFITQFFLFLFVVLMIPCVFTFYYKIKAENNVNDLKEAQIVENKNGTQKSIEIETYVKWSAAASIPICYQLEALKAQVVLTRTNTYNKLEKLRKSYPDLMFPASEIKLSYIEEEELESKIGKKEMEKYIKVLEEAVKSTEGEIIDTNKTIYFFPNANLMAKSGESYTAIIYHYFPNIK